MKNQNKQTRDIVERREEEEKVACSSLSDILFRPLLFCFVFLFWTLTRRCRSWATGEGEPERSDNIAAVDYPGYPADGTTFEGPEKERKQEKKKTRKQEKRKQKKIKQKKKKKAN